MIREWLRRLFGNRPADSPEPLSEPGIQPLAEYDAGEEPAADEPPEPPQP